MSLAAGCWFRMNNPGPNSEEVGTKITSEVLTEKVELSKARALTDPKRNGWTNASADLYQAIPE